MQANIKKVGFFYLLFVLMALVAIAQIVNLQFVHKPGRSLSKKTTREDVLPCTRGSILADDGRYLAFSIPEYRMGMDCVQPDSALFANGIDSLAICLANFYQDKKAAQYKKEIVERRKEGLQGGRRYLFLNRRLLTYQEMKEVSSFPILREGRGRGGRDEVKVDHRTYPYGRLGFRTLGYIKDQSEIPTIGIEGSCDSILRGTDGMQPMRLTEGRNWIVDTDRETIQPVDGLDVQLTLDIDMQDMAQNALINVLKKTNEVHAGTVVVMEVATGEIKAMVNLEKNGKGGFDETYNYAIGRKGEPGSVFKGATLTTLIEDKKLTLETVVPAPVIWNYGGGQPFEDSYLRNYPGTISIKRAFEISSNNIFRMQAAKYYDKNPKEFLDKLTNERRITHDFPFELKGMAKANLKDPDVKTGRGAWNMKDLPQIAMGYTVEITPLHTLNFYNAIANEGVMMRPHLVRNYQKEGEIVQEFKPEVLGKVCSKETAHEVWKAMRGVVESEGGTGYRVFKGCPVQVAGKTGTARIVFPQNGKYEDKAGHKMHQATFVGFFPYESPKYSMIAVVYSEPTFGNFYGATWCGPVFRQVAEQIYASSIDWQAPLPRKGSLPEADNYQSLQAGQDLQRGLVPDVKGMGLREAIALLEKAGYRVTFEGHGIVDSQTPAAGDTAHTRQIALKLKEQYRNETH